MASAKAVWCVSGALWKAWKWKDRKCIWLSQNMRAHGKRLGRKRKLENIFCLKKANLLMSVMPQRSSCTICTFLVHSFFTSFLKSLGKRLSLRLASLCSADLRSVRDFCSLLTCLLWHVPDDSSLVGATHAGFHMRLHHLKHHAMWNQTKPCWRKCDGCSWLPNSIWACINCFSKKMVFLLKYAVLYFQVKKVHFIAELGQIWAVSHQKEVVKYV